MTGARRIDLVRLLYRAGRPQDKLLCLLIGYRATLAPTSRRAGRKGSPSGLRVPREHLTNFAPCSRRSHQSLSRPLQGETLIERAAILDAVDDTAPEAKRLLPRSGPVRRAGLRLCSLSTGVADEAVILLYRSDPRTHRAPRTSGTKTGLPRRLSRAFSVAEVYLEARGAAAISFTLALFCAKRSSISRSLSGSDAAKSSFSSGSAARSKSANWPPPKW